MVTYNEKYGIAVADDNTIIHTARTNLTEKERFTRRYVESFN